MEIKTPSLYSLMEAYRAFGSSIATKHLSPAVEAALQPGLKRLEKNVPVGPTGNLRKGLGTKLVKYMDSLTVVGLAGYRKKGGKGSTNHMHLLEYGTRERTTRGKFASSYRRKKFKASWPSRGADAGRLSVLPQNRFNFYYVNWKGGTVKTGSVKPMHIIKNTFQESKSGMTAALRNELAMRLQKATKEFVFRTEKGLNTS